MASAQVWNQFEVLLHQAQKGCSYAEDQLLRNFEGLVVQAITEGGWFAIGLDREDLLQQGRIALLEAIRCYRSRCGGFPPFARLVIRRRLSTVVKQAIRHGGPPVVALEELAAQGREASLSEAAVMCDEEACSNLELSARWRELKERLSPLELTVLQARLRDEIYASPEELRTGGRRRAADNALVRIRQKFKHWEAEVS